MDAKLGDPRRVRRLSHVAEKLASAASSSFPKAMGSDAELEGTYRLLGNEEVSAEQVLGAHIRQTIKRCSSEPLTLVVHDTTEFRLDGEAIAEQVGRIRKNQRGFFGHYSFAQAENGKPLGVIALTAWKRPEKPKGKRRSIDVQKNPDRESLRWAQGCMESYERLADTSDVLHIMDREGDCYETFCELLEAEQRFVIRSYRNRRVDKTPRNKPSRKLHDALSAAPLFLEREVPLTKRNASLALKTKSKIYPNRHARLANVEVRAQPISFQRTDNQPVHLPEQTTLNFVEVKEPNPPAGQPAVHWRLATTEPIDTPKQVERVVDIYRRRWLIEEYFKAIKTGCAFEKRALRTANSVLTALALFSAIAWRMLLLRWAERQDEDIEATEALSQDQLLVLQAARAKDGYPLVENPTAKDVYLAIAGLGGHIKNNGPPGWIILQRGMEKLLMMERGWLAMLAFSPNRAQYLQTCDR